MTHLKKRKRCSACNGTGVKEENFVGNTKIFPPQEKHCFYCDGTGYKQYQIFNWMRDPEGFKYITKPDVFKSHRKEYL